MNRRRVLLPVAAVTLLVAALLALAAIVAVDGWTVSQRLLAVAGVLILSAIFTAAIGSAP